MIHAAAETFSILPRSGGTGRGTAAKVNRVFGPLKSSVILLRDENTTIVLLTSHFITHFYRISNLLRQRVARALEIQRDRVVCFSSHNHCVVNLAKTHHSVRDPEPDVVLAEDELTWEGEELLKGCVEAAGRLPRRLVPVSVRYGVGHERRITHNRKGRRADGSTYLMREADRLLLGEDFNGDIDDDAFVVGFFDAAGSPVAMLTQFTGHPVTAYHSDHPVVHGEYPQVACDDLSGAYGGVPVGFLQGCAGDTNSKGLLSDLTAEENVSRAEGYGHKLGETFIATARSLRDSLRHDLRLSWLPVVLPFDSVPPPDQLEARLAKAAAFLDDCRAGKDDETRSCDGLNFPRNMSMQGRQRLIQPVFDWLTWALSFHRESRLHEAPVSISLLTGILRIGDVGIVGLPCEPLMGIGRQIKQAAPTAITLPCGYMNDTSIAYIPDGPNVGDLDYVSAFYRYTKTMLPLRKPAGDLLASATVAALRESLK